MNSAWISNIQLLSDKYDNFFKDTILNPCCSVQRAVLLNIPRVPVSDPIRAVCSISLKLPAVLSSNNVYRVENERCQFFRKYV